MSPVPYWTHYHRPATVQEAVALLARHDGRARMVGGGTDLLLEIQQGHRPKAEALIDPTAITGLNRIDESDGFFVIGCGVTHSRIVKDPRLRAQATCLVEGCGVIGGPQVRNVATLAGNIAHALPAGDGTIGLLTLDGEIEVADAQGTRWMPVGDSFMGPGKSHVDASRMLITRMRFRPCGPGEGSAYRRVMRPQGVALPMISLGARIRLDGENIAAARVAIGPAGPVPFLAVRTMAYLAGRQASDATFREAAETALAEASLRDSPHRATAEYRAEMIRIQLPKTLAKAAERARTGQSEPEGVGL